MSIERRVSLRRRWQVYGPYLVAFALLIAGYWHYAPGAMYSLSAEHYRAWAFPAFRYSDIIWLYLRDNLASRPIPYRDYPLEYPPLTGLLSYLLSWRPDLPAYFLAAYLVLSVSALATVWALQRISGANAWLFALAPALFFYTGHQWDLAAIAVTAVSLAAIERGRLYPGILGLAIAVSLKLFPIVFVAALFVELLRDCRWRQLATGATTFAAAICAFNLPVALNSMDGWSFFFRWNRDRLADSGIWVLWRDAATADLTRWSLVAAVAGGIAITALALRQPGPLVIPLGATYLTWWLLVNKTFTTHLMLWVLLALALVSAPWWLWSMAVAIDVVGFQLGNYLNLYNIDAYRNAPLIRKAVDNVYDPLQIARSAVLLACTLWCIRLLGDPGRRAAFAGVARSIARSRVGTLRSGFPTPVVRPAKARQAANLGVWTVAIVVSAAATIVMTWPYLQLASTTTIVGFDPFLQIWLSEWVQHSLATQPLALFCANMFYPFAQTIAYTDVNLPGALLAWPIRLLTGDPILTNTVMTLASFVLAATGVFALVRHCSRNTGAALVAGLAYAFLPYRMVHLWHLNWLEGGLLPWFLLAYLRLLERPSLARAFTAGAFAACMTLISFYFSVQILLLVLLLTAGYWIAQRSWPARDFWRYAALAGGTALLLATPLLIPYLQVNAEQRLERTIADAEQYKALPSSYLQLAPWDQPNTLQQALGVRAAPNESLTEVGQAQHPDGHQHAEIVAEDALFPGLLVLLFAVVGAVAGRPRWLVGALLAAGGAALLLSLGPTWGPRQGAGASLPYGWLFDHAPLLRSMRVPARLGGLVGLALVLLAGLGLAATWQRLLPRLAPAHRPAAAVLLTALCGFLVFSEFWTGPIPLERVDRSAPAMAGAAWLATQPPGAVMEFPAESVFADPAAASVRRHAGETAFRSTLHWLPVVNGNSGFIPRSYSDFIERFVGEIPRPDGTTTGRISHLDAETVGLLQQLGVRYVVFNRDQYAPADWAAVQTEVQHLIDSGKLASAGVHGNQVIFSVLAPAVTPPPSIKLYAPTLLTPSQPWAPWLGLSAAHAPSVLALTRPTTLSLSWFDIDGKLLHRDEAVYPLPAVADANDLLCGARDCLTTRPITDLRRLPRPEATGAWQPASAGHYVVVAEVAGDLQLHCQIDLDIVADDATVQERGGDEPFRWAVCEEGSPYPVNNPGAPPLQRDPATITLAGTTIGLAFDATPRHDELLRAWFVLSPRGLPAPWRHVAFESPIIQSAAPAGEPLNFAWSADTGGTLEPGVYDLSVWIHRQTGGAWQHISGGPASDRGVIVQPDGALRWSGPLQVRLQRPPFSVPAGRATPLAVAVDAPTGIEHCTLTWRLLGTDGHAITGQFSSCTQPFLTVPATVAPGQYTLAIEAYSAVNGDRRLSDGVSLPVTVTDGATAMPS